ncbi:MAG: ArnT family glycosyltransferase [Nitrospinales bacterium]
MDLVLFFLIFSGFNFLGELICRSWNPYFAEPFEALVFQTIFGLIGVSLLTTLLAFLGLIYPQTGWIILSLIFLISGIKVVSGAKSLFQLGTSIPHRLSIELNRKDWFNLFNLGILFVLVFLALTLAQTPPIRTDSLVYHLAIPKAYLENHGIINLPNNIYSFFPLLFEMLFLFCMTFGREALPQLAGLGITLLLLCALILFIKQHFSTRYLALTPVLFFTVPTFFEVSTTAYIDIGVGALIFFSFYSWDRWRNSKLDIWFWFMVIFAASAWAAKLTALIVLPLVFLGIALEGRNRKNSIWVLKKLLCFSVVVFLFILPWWGKNYYYSGNPFVPLFMEVLGGADKINWDPERALLMDQYVKMFGMGRGFLDMMMLPINLTFFSEKNSLKFDGQIGILYFLLLPSLIWVWKKRSSITIPIFTIFTILMAFWFIYFQYARFLALAFPFLTILLIYGLELMSGKHSKLFNVAGPAWQNSILLIICVATLFNLSQISKEWNRISPLKYLIGLETRDQFLDRHLPPYAIYQAMNTKLPPEAKVLLIFARNYGYLAEREFISDSVYEAHTMQKIMTSQNSPEGIINQLKTRGITHLIFDNNFVFGDTPAFSIDQQMLMKDFLNDRSKLIDNKNGFYLYSFMVD